MRVGGQHRSGRSPRGGAQQRAGPSPARPGTDKRSVEYRRPWAEDMPRKPLDRARVRHTLGGVEADSCLPPEPRGGERRVEGAEPLHVGNQYQIALGFRSHSESDSYLNLLAVSGFTSSGE